MISRLILWDVDGTLVRAGPAAREAFDRAVGTVLGLEVAEHGVHMAGKTDPQIAMEILAALKVPEDEARRRLPAIMVAMERELADALETIREHGRALPGARPLLERLHSRPEVLQTVLTGNLAANAALKLRAFDLDRWIDLEVGAYGSDDQDRTRLVPVALEKLARRDGVRLDPTQVWVVGDTPRDLDCARAGGARCLLVATGRYPSPELAGLGADALLPDLADTERVAGILLDGIQAGR